MKKSRIFKQYVWLVTTLQTRGGLTLEELNRLWVEDGVADGNPLPRTSFNRYRDGILQAFGLVIECDKSYHYYIDNPKSICDDTLESWMLSTLTIGDWTDVSSSATSALVARNRRRNCRHWPLNCFIVVGTYWLSQVVMWKRILWIA